MHPRIVSAAVLFCLALLSCGTAAAQMAPSTCHAVAEAMPNATFASFGASFKPAPVRLAALDRDEVQITYAHHATYVIESAAGVTVATDYSGFAGDGVVPRVATMNKAHATHHTDYPDPGIEHILRGWNPEGGAARHEVTIEDVYIRNVPTDIRGFGGMEPDGNSIFIFEVAGLCIGYLGHLHHDLTDSHYAAIGRLDIVMVPVDGAMTISQGGMGEIVRRLRSSIVLPMHRFRSSIQSFLDRLGPGFAVEQRMERSLTVSMRSLPDSPTVIILQGV